MIFSSKSNNEALMKALAEQNQHITKQKYDSAQLIHITFKQTIFF